MESGLPSLILWALSLAALICSVVLGAILSYHWFAFGSNTFVSGVALAIYATGAFVLIMALIAISAAI